MRSAVVFYSLEGNTRSVANQLAKRLGAETFEVRPTKAYPTKGLAKFIAGGKDSTFGKAPKIEPLEMDPSAYDLVVLALPVWAGKAAAPINSFVEGRTFGKAKIALVIASASGDASGCARDLAGKLGRATANMPTLSLKNPGKMGADELATQVDDFADRLQHSAGGAF